MFKIQKFRSFGFGVLNLFRISCFIIRVSVSSQGESRTRMPSRARRSERRVYPSSTTWPDSATRTGIEPTLPPWQGSRLPLHHGRLLWLPNCQRPSQLPTPRKKPGVVVTPGFEKLASDQGPSVTCAVDARAGYWPIVRQIALRISAGNRDSTTKSSFSDSSFSAASLGRGKRCVVALIS
jgi:hypothetical protein